MAIGGHGVGGEKNMWKTAIFAGVALLAMPVGAQTLDGQAVRSVGYADLNLATPEGRAALDMRIARAARTICAADPAFNSASMAHARAKCEAETRDSTRAAVKAAINRHRVYKSTL
ncbi:MAG: UrcA family protein [Sphingomonadaceae bacterium]